MDDLHEDGHQGYFDPDGYAPPPPPRLSPPVQLTPPAEQRLVIALDYGTTFTGLAFATPRGEKVVLGEIDVNKNWGPGQGNYARVPSVISYPEEEWGMALSANAVAMVHTKLELDFQDVLGELNLILDALDGMQNLDFEHIKLSGRYTYKSPEDIVTDFLTKVFMTFKNAVNRSISRHVRETFPTDLVITVPTNWSHKAMNSTYRAITSAGFNRDTFKQLREVIFVTEPEAAAMFTARWEKQTMGREFLRERECFILCDAGGGTVDVVSYRVKRLQPSLELEQIGFPTARKCGSIFIDRAFQKWLRGLIGDENYSLLDSNAQQNKIGSHSSEGSAMRDLMKKFEILKRAFKMDTPEMHIELPYPLDNLNIPRRVNNGEVTITNKLMRALFHVCIRQIFDLIKGHINQIDQLRAKTRNIFLVGGFGASTYLREELELTYKIRDIQLHRPDDSWTAVVRGAVICGIEKSTTRNLVRATSCRRSYGICVKLPFSDVKNNKRDLIDDNSVARANNQLLWLLNKGDLIRSDRALTGRDEITVSFAKDARRVGKITIYMYNYDDARPNSLRDTIDDVPVAHILSYDLSKYSLDEFQKSRGKDGKSMYHAFLELTLTLTGENLQATLVWKNRVLVSPTSIVY